MNYHTLKSDGFLLPRKLPEESDNEPIQKHNTYLGKRVSRGLFKTSNDSIINADVNAGYNIMKKAFPNAVSVDGIEAFGLMPQKMHRHIFDGII